MENFIVIMIIAIILTLVILYIIKAKKSGVKCIGCPDAKNCQGRANGCCGNCGGCVGNKNMQ